MVSESTAARQTALVLRGVVDLGDADGEDLSRKGRTASLAHRRFFHVGQTLVLSTTEFERLKKLGVVAAVR
jgi:hypothetical protein